ncbi:hypothetical protein [Erythrobacter donghaensis]|uniref:hypothetical protein n=1 Tax=Erythrobacter donghaensis TaxID=267135 RepID=UPI000A9B974D|nr:hypothetical protein [Erythrobacter donghaensis]
MVEDDARVGEAIGLIGDVRRAGFTAELVASGSLRKRYDKAVKRAPKVILSLKPEMAHSVTGGHPEAEVLGTLRPYY